ncbi:MAG TPA: hypothetical protein VI277_09625 [Candidatus Limnocylindria bacterium]
MRITRTLGVAGALIISALVGGTIIGATLATDETPTATDGAGGAYCEAFLDAFAAELGVSTDEVTAAGKAAAGAAIDAAVAAGDLSAERAEAVKERIDGAEAGCGLFKAGWVRGFGHGAAHGWARGAFGGDAIGAAADALGIETSDLWPQLRDAGSLEALATTLGANYDEVKAAIVADVQANLDATDLGDERKAQVIERLTAWLDDGGDVGGARPAGGHWMGPGRHGPWGDGSSDDPEASPEDGSGA